MNLNTKMHPKDSTPKCDNTSAPVSCLHQLCKSPNVCQNEIWMGFSQISQLWGIWRNSSSIISYSGGNLVPAWVRVCMNVFTQILLYVTTYHYKKYLIVSHKSINSMSTVEKDNDVKHSIQTMLFIYTFISFFCYFLIDFIFCRHTVSLLLQNKFLFAGQKSIFTKM